MRRRSRSGAAEGPRVPPGRACGWRRAGLWRSGAGRGVVRRRGSVPSVAGSAWQRWRSLTAPPGSPQASPAPPRAERPGGATSGSRACWARPEGGDYRVSFVWAAELLYNRRLWFLQVCAGPPGRVLVLVLPPSSDALQPVKTSQRCEITLAHKHVEANGERQ